MAEPTCIVVCDGLEGLPESITTLWPHAGGLGLAESGAGAAGAGVSAVDVDLLGFDGEGGEGVAPVEQRASPSREGFGEWDSRTGLDSCG